jgi:RNA polymerase sigma-70 factor (ECF subfamily)
MRVVTDNARDTQRDTERDTQRDTERDTERDTAGDTERDTARDTDAEREARMRALVELVLEPVRRYLYRRTDAATADDVIGETLLVCWRRLDEVPDDALPWAIVVARQCLSNAQRAERRRIRLIGRIIAIDPPSVATDESPASLIADGAAEGTLEDGTPADGTAELARVTRALARLRRNDAEILRLWAWDELPSPQLAVVLGISANAAAIRLHRAKARLKQELLKSDDATGHIAIKEGSDDAQR